MNDQKRFTTKDDASVTVQFSFDEIEEIVPDADMRFTLVVLKNGDKHFVCGTEMEIRKSFEE